MTFLLRYWPHLLAILLAFGAGAWVGSQLGNARANKAELALSHVQRDAAQQLAAEEARARQAEHRHAADMARIGDEHQEALRNAQAGYDNLLGKLNTGERRLRHEIAELHTARLSESASTTRELEGAAQRGAELIAAAVGVGARCDAVQRGLISAYEVNL